MKASGTLLTCARHSAVDGNQRKKSNSARIERHIGEPAEEQWGQNCGCSGEALGQQLKGVGHSWT